MNNYSRNYIPNYNFNQQNMYDQIDGQIAQLQQMREQIKNNNQQQPAINQTFQLNGTQNTMKYVNSIDEVNKEYVLTETPFFSKDMSVVWIKNSKGEVKTYTLAEIIQKDEKDILIESLQYQIEELKKGAKTYESESNNNDGIESITSKKSSNVSVRKSSNAK